MKKKPSKQPKDFLDEVSEERTAKNPAFPKLVLRAVRRAKIRSSGKPRAGL